MSRWPRPDFLATAPRPPRLASFFAAAGIAAAAWAGVEAWRLGDEIERENAAVSAAASARPPTARGPAAASRSLSPLDAEARRSAHRVAVALAHPWAPVLATLESATPSGVQWLGFDHTAESGELRLEGQAVDVSAAVSLVDALAGIAGWNDVALVRLQRPEAARGAAPATAGFGFAVEVRLDARALAAEPSEP